ncbi:MAG: ribonuclease D [Gammaproteobacteria bacterium]|nr:ribonuclease D [Gammaproteobacteria bacterium]
MSDIRVVGMGSSELGEIIGDEPVIALDTEFMREKTYFAQLCLVQVATRRAICCADPLTGPPADSATWDKLLERTCVIHSARQDLEVIYQATRRFPARVFDTQIAAALLGYPPQMGYGNLVEELFDKRLDKSHTRADWSRRPLPEEQLAYAAEDVEFLLPAFDALGERLDRQGRLSWANEDSADLLDSTLYASDPAQAIDRLKGARNLRGAARAAAVRLAAWREERAIAGNRPRQWIIRDAVLLEIATQQPASKKSLARMSGLAERTLQRYGDTLLELVAKSATDDVDYRPPARPNEAQKAALKRMQQLVAERAGELQLAAELLAPKKELAAALAGNRDLRVLRGWRQDLLGADLLAILADVD